MRLGRDLYGVTSEQIRGIGKANRVHMLFSQPVILVIGSRLIEMMIRRGGRTECIRLDVELPSEPHAWHAALGALAAPLGLMVAEHRLAGAPTVVLYESPSGSSQLTSVATSREGQALAAARLAALGSIGGSYESAIADACEIGCDAAGDPPRRHVVAAAERHETLCAIADLIDAIGLRTERIVPSDAIAIANMIQRAMAHRGPTHGWLDMGREQSWFVVVGEGQLRLFRPIRFGVDQLIEVLTRPICLNSARADFSLNLEQARALLAEHGIPDRDHVLDAAAGLCGKHIMPLLAPVLQRVIVELKQSLRFGLTEPQRRELTMTLCGPGAAVSGLATLIGEAIETTVESQRNVASSSASPAVPLPGGLDPQACLALLNSCPNLLPAKTIADHMARRFNRGVWVGLAAGLCLLTLDSVRLDRQIADEHERLSEVRARMDEAQSRAHDREQAGVRAAAWRRMRNSYVAATDFSPNYSAVLREVALATPKSIRLTRLESANAALESVIGQIGPLPTLVLEAYAFEPDADDHITAVVESLRSSALVEGVALGSIVRSELDGKPARRFDLQIRLRYLGSGGDGSLVDVPAEGSR